MTGKDVVKQIMAENDVTNAQLANRLGITQATMWARLNNQNAKDLPLSVFTEMLETLGYEVIVRRKKEEPESKEMVLQIDEPTKPEGRGRPRVHPTTGGE